MTFDGFISYSHAADGRLAPAVQRGLHRLAKPWHRRRALWIFRDQTGLAVTPGLWSSIQTALDGSEYFVLLASPEAAGSPWVNREIEHWMATKSADRILPVVTDGEWAWDDDRGDFTEDSTAVPAALRGVFGEEPFFLDLRWARGSEHLSLHHSRFRDAIAQLAAPMHGLSKDELEGEDVRQHRRAKRLRSGAVATLVVLALVASLTGVSAVRNAERAKDAAAEALRQQNVADTQRDSAEKSAAEARRQQDLATAQQELARQQQARAAKAAAEATRSEGVAREQQRLADQAAADAKRQRKLADQAKSNADQAKSDTAEQQRLAQEAAERAKAAAERAKKLQAEAARLAAIAAEQRRLADQAAAEAKKQQEKADQQQRLAVSRRLLNQAGTVLVDDPQTALRLGAAAQNLNPDTTTLGQFTGLLNSTNYAGMMSDVVAAESAPDGVLAATSGDGRLSLWNAADPQKPVRIATLADPVATDSPLVFSKDGRTLAFLSPSYRVVLWDVANRSRPNRLATLTTDGRVDKFVFSDDKTVFVTGQNNGIVTTWDTTDMARPVELHRIADYDSRPVENLALSPNGRLLIVDRGRWVPFYDLTDPAFPEDVTGMLGWGVTPLAFSPDGTILAVGVAGGVALYHIASKTPGMAQMRTALVAPETVETPQMPDIPDDDTDIPDPSATTPGTTEPSGVIQTPTFPDFPDEDDDPYWNLEGLTGQVTSLAFSPDGTLVVAGDGSGGAAVWETDGSAAPIAGVEAHGAIASATVDQKSGLLITADATKAATIWNLTPPGVPDQLAMLTTPDTTPRGAFFSPDGRSLIVAGTNGKANTWNTSDPARPVPGAGLTLRGEEVRSVKFSPDGRKVATVANNSGTLTLADAKQPARATTLTTFPSGSKNEMAFSPDGRTLAVVADAGTLMVWDVADVARPALLATASGGTFGSALAFTPDGRTLAAAGTDRSISLWNMVNRSAPARLATMTGQTNTVTSVAFTPDGRTLASGSYDRTTVLWDVTNRSRPARLTSMAESPGWVTSVAFSPDDDLLAVGTSAGETSLWDASDATSPVRLATADADSDSPSAGVMFRTSGHTLAITGQQTEVPASTTLWSYGKLMSLHADPAKYACGVAGRGLNAEEWARFIPEIKYRNTCAN
ncbi:TIR domain-containing protein [Actinoplanes sp. NPDC026619]|uniref:TIR domain-containing protein n=1 Tax=Actinoplanes sp. NPDC026619 TaxID=3155798 RepID=UPI0033E12D69